MSLICDCGATAISNVPLDSCPIGFGEVQKVAFQRRFSTGTTLNTIADPTLLASWTPLLAATDGTKVVQSPYLQAPESVAGEIREFGGPGETRNGIPVFKGRGPATFNAMIHRVAQATIKAIKAYECEGDLAVWYIDESGNIAAIADDPAAPTTYYPIPVFQLKVGDLKFGQYNDVDMNSLQWYHAPNWSDNVVFLKPTDFNALTDLVTP